MAKIRITGNAVPSHQAMHDLKLHHDAPEMEMVDGQLLGPVGDCTTFNTRENPEQLAARIRQEVPGAQIEVRGLWGWWKL